MGRQGLARGGASGWEREDGRAKWADGDAVAGKRTLTAGDNRGAAKRQPRGKVGQRHRCRAAVIGGRGGGGGERCGEAFVEVAPLREAVYHLRVVRWLGLGVGPAL